MKNWQDTGLSVRHNLYLYNDTQVEKFGRRVAEKLETGSIAVTNVLRLFMRAIRAKNSSPRYWHRKQLRAQFSRLKIE